MTSTVLTGTLAVRVEDDTSIGRSYSKRPQTIPGLGAERRLLRTKTFQPDPATLAYEAYTYAKCHASQASREDILAYFLNTWHLTDTLFSALRDDSVFYMIPDTLRRPLVFYFCHPAALYVNKMKLVGLMENINLYFQKLFETGVDEMSWDDMDAMQDEDFAWPTIAECIEFRETVKARVIEVIKSMPDPREKPITQDSPYWCLLMGFEHEHIHLETSAVLIHQLPIDAVVEPPRWRTAPTFAAHPSAAPANELTPAPASTVALGKPRDFPAFGWDNEYGHRHVEVPAFKASKFMVSNAEFLPFVLDGGYLDKRWWVSPNGDDEGWRWRSFRDARHPHFWVSTTHPDMVAKYGVSTLVQEARAARAAAGADGGEDAATALSPYMSYTRGVYHKDDGHPRAGSGTSFRLRTVYNIIDMPWDWPVDANYLEAAAFLRWKAAQEGLPPTAYRLPTEAEHAVMRGDASPYDGASTGVGQALAGVAPGAPAAVSALPGGEGRTLLSVPAGSPVQALHSLLAASQGVEGIPAPQAPSPAVDELLAAMYHKAATPSPALEVAAREAAAAAADPDAHVDVMLHPVAPGNINMRWHSSTPVNMYAPSSSGFHDTHGNVWEWVEDHFAPLPGFEIHYLYDDFSTPCFDGWHNGILGGSWVSAGNLGSTFARYHFRRHFFQHLGFRYVEVAAPEAYPGAATVVNLWEGQAGPVSKEITNTFGTAAERFPVRSIAEAAAVGQEYPRALAAFVARAYATHGAPPPATGARVLHLGCGVGGVTFELAASGFERVVGVDSSEPFIRHARILQHHGQFEYERITEGVLTKTTLARVPHGTADRAKAFFVLSDARALGPDVTAHVSGEGFDVVVVDSFLCRMRQPLELITQLSKYVRTGGLVVVVASNDWNPAFTPRNSWLGGFKMNGEDCDTLGMLKYHLKRTGLEFLEAADVPRVTALQARRATIDVLEASVFKQGPRKQ